MSISEFRIYKLDNEKLDPNWTESHILSVIRDNLKDEFDIPSGNLNFAFFSTGILIYNFSGLKIDNNHEGPIWYNYLGMVGENEKMQEMKNDYKQIKTSVISVFKIGNNYYLISYGNAHHSLPTTLIDEKFGITLTKKLVTKEGKIRSLYQSVIKGDLESTYKSLKNTAEYNAMLDRTNLGKNTKGLNGVGNSRIIFHDIPELQNLHLGLEGSKGLKINVGNIIGGGLDKILFTKLLKKINYFNNLSNSNSYKIPDLIKINNSHQIYSILLGRVKNELVSSRLNIYFSPDLFIRYCFGEVFNGNTIIKFNINYDGESIEYSSNSDGEFINLDFISFLKEKGINFNNIENITFSKIQYIDFNGIEKTNQKKPSLLKMLQGEIEYEGKLYLFEGEEIYEPDQDFKDVVISTFNDIINTLKITSSDFLHNWDINLVPGSGVYQEKIFNRAHDLSLESISGKDGFYCFDKGVSGKYGLNGIEICDLIKKEGDNIFFIHVKESHGADLRILFSQGKVGTQKILEDPSKTSRHIRNRSTLTSINSTKIKNKNFTIVYAIKNSKTTNIFTLYAKYELINTLEYFHSIGIDNVKIYEIN